MGTGELAPTVSNRAKDHGHTEAHSGDCVNITREIWDNKLSS